MPMGPQIVPPMGSHVLNRPWVGLQIEIVVFPDHTHLLLAHLSRSDKVSFCNWASPVIR